MSLIARLNEKPVVSHDWSIYLTACKSMAQYTEDMKNLESVVKPNGYVLIFSTIRENADVGYSFVKNTKVLDLALQF